MIWAIIIVAIVAYFYKGSCSFYFFKSDYILEENWNEIEHLLILKGRSIIDINKYKDAYFYFVENPKEYDGATIVKDLCDIPDLDLDAMLHDYESITFASYSYLAWFKSAFDYFVNMSKNGKGNQVLRFIGLLVLGIGFVPYKKYIKE